MAFLADFFFLLFKSNCQGFRLDAGHYQTILFFSIFIFHFKSFFADTQGNESFESFTKLGGRKGRIYSI